ncbi:hypothetical protein NPS01_37810 [Nocardioides psychrotolerans]|uniref:Uncharacterized protein n=1 Tax=Nocardioides psychrotolerans TaxID=1005945 RepID=A0A1I3I755_9ACTN|nr:hypothetical protein [Nocardioides psychrotolerans]GEP40118.1 hypothetical protein NPS01_37810 [Nocardioides psychrotolerans]SFI43766.1 hypothetical protein SAMN05216561_108145 [Nocardioides psychrotolerans]
MTNAAYLLASALREFATPSAETPEARRGFSGQEDLDAWREHSRVCDLVRTVDYTLQGMDAVRINVDMFTAALPRWYAGVNFATIPWGKVTQGNGTRQVCTDGDINLLEALGLIINTTGHVALTEADRRNLSDVLEQAIELVDDASSDLPADVRQYLHTLLLKARMVVDNVEKYGHEAVRQVALELGGAMAMQAGRAQQRGDTERAGRWRAAAFQLMIGFLGGTASGGGEVLAAEALKQLGG